MAELNPYDTGKRLEPHPWVTNGIVVPGGRPRLAEDNEFGRVDFDTDDGTTIATVYLEPVENGYRMMIDQHTEDYLQVSGAKEPPSLIQPTSDLDAEYRTRQMMLLDAGLAAIGKTYSDDIFYVDDGDTSAFATGNYTFRPLMVNDDTLFAISEVYATGPEEFSDDPIPSAWTWLQKDLVRLPDGTERAEITAEGTTIPSDIDNLIDRALAWVQQTAQRVNPDQDGPAPHRRGPGRDPLTR